MKVTIIAHTAFPSEGSESATDWTPNPEHLNGRPVGHADALAEFAGRCCYQSWNRPNPKTATNKGYLANIISQGHFSVLEHSSLSFYVEGVSRYLTHELVRHRHGSWSQLSTRYVDESDADIVRHPSMDDEEWRQTVEFFAEAQSLYSEMVARMERRGLSRKQAREAARFVLPGGLETRIIVTSNIRGYRDILSKRWHVAADAEIREMAGLMLTHLRDYAPNSFLDFPDEPFGS